MWKPYVLSYVAVPMIIFGWGLEREKSVGTDQLVCPVCEVEKSFDHRRIVRYFHIYFIPLFPVEVAGEFYRCHSCGNDFSPELLHLTELGSADETGLGENTPDQNGLKANLKNLVSLTDAAANEIKHRIQDADFEEFVAVRVIPERAGSNVDIRFDLPVSDGREWMRKSNGLVILVDKNDADLVRNRTIDFRNGVFRLV